MSENKLKRLIVTREFINPLLQGDMGLIAGLPDDVKLRRTYRDGARDCWIFVIHSDEFESVEEGVEIPVIRGAAVSLDYERRKKLHWDGPRTR